MASARYSRNAILFVFGSFAMLISIFMILILYWSLDSKFFIKNISLRNNHVVSNHNNISNEDIYESYRRKVGSRKRSTVIHSSTASRAATSFVPETAYNIIPESTFSVPQNKRRTPPPSTLISNKNKVAIMVIYVGNSLPAWFRTFSLSVEVAVNPLLHWIIFVTEAYEMDDTFDNIKIIRITRHELYKRLTRLDEFSNAIMYMKNLIEHAPYSLVEFKPCLATIFEVLFVVLHDRFDFIYL
jgi:hypothetical protein